MYNKAICDKASGRIKYIIVGTDLGFLEIAQPRTDEFAVTLSESDYHMAVRKPENFMIEKKIEWVSSPNFPKSQTPIEIGYEMKMVAEPVKEEPEIPVEAPPKEKHKKK